MEKVMTNAEIESEFDSEWVLVIEPETNEQLEVVKGKVFITARTETRYIVKR